MTHSPTCKVLPLGAAAALTLASCSAAPDDAPETETTTTETTASSETTDSRPPESTTSTKPTTTEVREVSPEELAGLTEVPADTFKATPVTFAVGFPGVGTKGCMVPTERMAPSYAQGKDEMFQFNCDIGVEDPANPAREYDTPPESGERALSMQYEPTVGFYTFSSQEPIHKDEYTKDYPELQVGQKVALSGFTLARPAEDTVVIQRGVHSLTISNGNTAVHSPPVESVQQGEPNPDLFDLSNTAAPEGTPCNVVSASDTETGETHHFSLIAHADNTDCTTTFDVAQRFITALQAGEVQPPTMEWSSPDGWSCSMDYMLPGTHTDVLNAAPLCRNEGGGAFVIAGTEML